MQNEPGEAHGAESIESLHGVKSLRSHVRGASIGQRGITGASVRATTGGQKLTMHQKRCVGDDNNNAHHEES
jgi:hypothetical protein